jgi:hypothetical protein
MASEEELRAIVDPPADCPRWPGDGGEPLDPISAAVRDAIAHWPAVTERLRGDRAAAAENVAIARARYVQGGDDARRG